MGANGVPPKNEVGNVYGKLTVKAYIPSVGEGGARWLCVCTCGQTRKCVGTALRSAQGPRSCTACMVPREPRYKREGRNKAINELGKTYGWLVVKERTLPRKDVYGNGLAAEWKCQCRCGNFKTVTGDNLRRGMVISCGCYRKKLPTANLPGQSGRADIHGTSDKEHVTNG